MANRFPGFSRISFLLEADLTGKGYLRALTPSERYALGFNKWDEEGLILIPLWAYNYIANGEELQSITGDKAIKGKDKIDLDQRFGCIAYGFLT